MILTAVILTTFFKTQGLQPWPLKSFHPQKTLHDMSNIETKQTTGQGLSCCETATVQPALANSQLTPLTRLNDIEALQRAVKK